MKEISAEEILKNLIHYLDEHDKLLSERFMKRKDWFDKMDNVSVSLNYYRQLGRQYK